MRKLGRKLFALLLCVMLCCSLMPVYASEKPAWAAADGTMTFRSYGLASGGSAPNAGEKASLSVTVCGSDSDFRSLMCGYNRTVELRVKASNASGTPKYQWYKIKKSNINFDTGEFTYSSSDAISGATKAKYTTPAITDIKNYQYFACVVTDGAGKKASAMFEVTAIYDIYPYPLQNAPNGVYLPYIFAISINEGYFYYEGGGQPTSTYSLSNATKYQIYRKEKGGSWASLKTIKGAGPDGPGFDGDWTPYIKDYTDTTAKMGVTYAYRYRAYLNGMWTDKSDAQSITFNPFTDVSLSEDRAQYIAWAYNNSVVKGDGAGHFNPDDPCTRMNFVMILWKMHGKPSVKGSNPFTDVSGDTSVAAVKWAVKKGLVTGTSATTFSPDSNLSRINIIMILYKLAGSPKASTTSKYEDISGSKTTKAVNWAVKKGIIAPLDSTHFGPNENCSRALLVEILCKYNDLYKIL